MRKLSILIALIMLFILVPVSPADAATAPTVDTGPFTIVKATSGNVSGDIESDNGSPIIQRGIVYSLTSNPTIGGLKTIVGGTLGKFTVNISNLSTNSVYYYAAYAINGVGVSYGPIKSLRTKKDNTPPTIIGATVAINNTYIDVNMSEKVYGINKTALTLGKFKWTFISNGGTATAATITNVTRTDGTPLLGGESTFRFWLSITGIPSGVETIQIWPFNGTSVYDASNNAMASTQTTGPKNLNNIAAPKIFSAFLSSNNTYMDITMTKGVYGSGKLPLTASDFSIDFTQNDGTANNAVITGVSNKFGQPLVGGETVIRVYISVSGVPDGTEFVTIHPTDGSSIYDAYGTPMSADQSTGPKTLNDLLSPTIESTSLSADNSYVDIDFSQGVYNSTFDALSPTDLQIIFTKNGGNTSSVAISSLSKTDGTPLLGGESKIRVHLNISGIPSGEETIEITPAGPSSIYDYNGNVMFETQTTGIMLLNSKASINTLVHTIKTANGRNPGALERTFIPGDFVPMSIKIDVVSTLTNPVFIANLGSDNDNFHLKELTSSNGLVDTSSVLVYKNGVKLDKSFVEIVKESSNNTLRVSVNQSFTFGDIVEVVYHTRFALTTKALRSKTKPLYGGTVNFPCHIEWGNPTNYYSSDYPGPTGTDQFNASIITADPIYLQ